MAEYKGQDPVDFREEPKRPFMGRLLLVAVFINLVLTGKAWALMPPGVETVDIFVDDNKTSAGVDIRGWSLGFLGAEDFLLEDLTTGATVFIQRNLSCRSVGSGVGRRDAPPGSVQKKCRLWLSCQGLDPGHEYEFRVTVHLGRNLRLPLRDGVCFGNTGPAGRPAAHGLFPVERDGLWGYRDARHVLHISPRFAVAGPFSAWGLAAVVRPGEGWLYIDQRGGTVIRPHILDNGPDPFSEGLARFWEGGLMGFFSPRGEVVIEPGVDFARPFCEGRSAFCRGCRLVPQGEYTTVRGGLWGFLDPFGREVVPARFEEVGDFKNGRAVVKEKGREFVLDREGRVLSIRPALETRATNP